MQYNQELARLSCHKDEFQQRKTFVCGYRLALWEKKQNKNWLRQYVLELLKAKHGAKFTCLPTTA